MATLLGFSSGSSAGADELQHTLLVVSIKNPAKLDGFVSRFVRYTFHLDDKFHVCVCVCLKAGMIYGEIGSLPKEEKKSGITFTHIKQIINNAEVYGVVIRSLPSQQTCVML